MNHFIQRGVIIKYELLISKEESLISDMETCYKMFTREVLQKLKLRAKRFDFEPEITAKIIKRVIK